jgi:hypothetical protein
MGMLVGAGLAAAALTAVATTKPWMRLDIDEGEVAQLPTSGGQLPLATALSLVVLAAWGVLLVTRARTRLVVGWLTAAAALATLVTVLSGWFVLPEWLRDKSTSLDAEAAATSPTAWFWVALGAAAVSAGVAVVAARRVGSWPEMGTRYDAPTAAAEAAEEEATSLDLWKAMDEGRDPTAGG